MITVQLDDISIEKVKNFADKMISSNSQRPSRTGGKLIRDKRQLRDDIVEGKIAEHAVYQFLKNEGFSPTKPNMVVMPLGDWDGGVDLTLDPFIIEVKASQRNHANLLLLTAKDLQNKNGKTEFEHSPGFPSFIIAVNVDSTSGIADIEGYIPKKTVIDAISKTPPDNLFKRGEVIPGSNPQNEKNRLDADNLVWLYPNKTYLRKKLSETRVPSMYSIDSFVPFLKRILSLD